jgi:hypothetical protein
MEEKEKHIPCKVRVIAHFLRAFYVSIYDSCQVFSSKLDQGSTQKLFQTLVNLAQNPMKTIWERRGLHHTKLVLDGIVKYRCIFKDFDPSFEAKQEDYDNAERILIEMVNNWEFDMSLKEEWRGLSQ